MSAGKVLALIVVVASFAIVAVAVSWCCWCVRSRFGSDKSIQAVKSVATVTDTIDSSRDTKSSLSTFPTTATTAMPPGPRATDSGPRLLSPAVEVNPDAAKLSLPPIPSTVFHSTDSARRSPTSAGAAGALTERGTSYATSPQNTRHEDEIFRRLPEAQSLQRTSSKEDLFSSKDGAQATEMHASCPAPGTDSVRKRTTTDAGAKNSAGAESPELSDSRNEKSSMPATFTSAYDTAPGKDADTTKAVTEVLRGVLDPDPEDLRCKDSGQKSYTISGVGTASQQKSPATDSSAQPSSKLASGPESPAAAAAGVYKTAPQFEKPSAQYRDTLDGASPSSRPGQISTTEERKNERASRSSNDPTMVKKVTDVSPGFQTPKEPENFEVCKARNPTPPTKRAGQNPAEKRGDKGTLHDKNWVGKRCLLRKAQRATVPPPKKGDDTPEVSIVINVPKKEVSMLELTKGHMLANANHCSPTAKKESL